MKRILGLFCLICLLGIGGLYAQDHYVEGKVLDITDPNNIVPFRPGTVRLYFVSSREEADVIQKNLIDERNYYTLHLNEAGEDMVVSTEPDYNGDYSCDVAYENGYILSFIGTTKKITKKNFKLEKIKGRDVVNFNLSLENIIDDVEIIGRMPNPKALDPTAPTIIGNIMFFNPQFAAMGDKSDRIIYQPYVTSCFQEKDTIIEYIQPIVLEGAEFAKTQERRMGYVAERDPLHEYVLDTLITPLGRDTTITSFIDTTIIPKDVMTLISKGDTTKISKGDTTKISKGDLMIIPLADTTVLSLHDNKYFSFTRSYKFTMPDPDAYYQVRFSKVTQEYTGIVEQLDTVVCKCQREDPLQYFQYSFDTYSLDPLKYRPSSQLRARNDADTVSLTFLVGRTQLDPANPKNETEWAKIVSRLREIKEMKGSKIQAFEIVGVSSPEGGYQSNLDLARGRANYALNRLTQQGLLQRNTAATSKGEVAGWDKVADLMEANYPDKAAELREIIANHETIDAQYGKIRVLPYYQLIKDSILPQLRCVRTSCKYIVRRNLKPAEIVEIYNTDPSFRFEPVEYWTLIQYIKDPKERVEICKRALRDNQFDTPLRPFAANELARTYMEMDVVDTLLLKEFIFDSIRVNQPLEITETYTKIYNPDALIANQVCMLLKGRYFFSAASLVRRIEDMPQYRELSLLVACLNGYYAKDATVLNANLGKDLINTVVLHLAMGAKQNKEKVSAATQRYHNFEAMKLIRQLNDLPAEQKALGYYLKAVIYNRLGYELSTSDDPFKKLNGPSYAYLYADKAVECLLKCFELDESFIKRCQGDAYIRDKYDNNFERKGEGKDKDIYEKACERYYNWKNGDAELIYTVLDDMEDEFGLSAPDPTPEELIEWGLIKE